MCITFTLSNITLCTSMVYNYACVNILYMYVYKVFTNELHDLASTYIDSCNCSIFTDSAGRPVSTHQNRITVL